MITDKDIHTHTHTHTYTHTMEYYSDIRDEGNPVICVNMNESEGYYTN